jgi:hypothetical protein
VKTPDLAENTRQSRGPLARVRKDSSDEENQDLADLFEDFFAE